MHTLISPSITFYFSQFRLFLALFFLLNLSHLLSSTPLSCSAHLMLLTFSIFCSPLHFSFNTFYLSPSMSRASSPLFLRSFLSLSQYLPLLVFLSNSSSSPSSPFPLYYILIIYYPNIKSLKLCFLHLLIFPLINKFSK